jgi:hypothetical protein
MDLNKTQVSCVGHMYTKRFLFSLVELLYRNIFSLQNITNRHFIYNSTTFFISINPK